MCELNCSINQLKIYFFQNKRVLSDATYKIIVEGYPILTIGTTDQCRSFHPFGFAIVFREREEDFEFMFNAVKSAVKSTSSNDYP